MSPWHALGIGLSATVTAAALGARWNLPWPVTVVLSILIAHGLAAALSDR